LARHLVNFTVEQLPDRRIRRAGLLWEIGELCVAFDADIGEFARVPGRLPGTTIRSLSADGTRMLLVASEGGNSAGNVCVLTFGNGEERWFDTPDYQIDQDAMLAPDGEMVAVLTSDEERDPGYAVVSLLDPTSGRRRRLWEAVGAASWESRLCWSPDGRLIAATYMVWDDELDNDALSTVVIDATDGTVRAGPFIRTFILGGSYATWLSDHELCYKGEYDELLRLLRVDLNTGRIRTGPALTGRVWGIVDGRHIQEATNREDPTAAASEFYTTNIDGTDRSHLFTIHPKVKVGRFHLAPNAFLKLTET
jgi:hypothetical protein